VTEHAQQLSGRDDDSERTRERRPVDRTLLLVSLAIAVGLVLVVRGLVIGVTGDERSNLPSLVESVDPAVEAVQVLRQTRVFVDLATGYTGVLVIDGLEIETINVDQFSERRAEPGQQVDLPPVTIFESGNSTLSFAPGDGAPIESFTNGEHQAQVIYWSVDEGRQRSRSFTWTFNVV
jgi:hypothetical protein